MEYKIPNFNIGDVTVEYDIVLGEVCVTAVHMYGAYHKDIIDALPDSAIEEIREELTRKHTENGLLEALIKEIGRDEK